MVSPLLGLHRDPCQAARRRQPCWRPRGRRGRVFAGGVPGSGMERGDSRAPALRLLGACRRSCWSPAVTPSETTNPAGCPASLQSPLHWKTRTLSELFSSSSRQVPSPRKAPPGRAEGQSPGGHSTHPAKTWWSGRGCSGWHQTCQRWQDTRNGLNWVALGARCLSKRN